MIVSRSKFVVLFFLFFVFLSMNVQAESLLTEQQAIDILVSQIKKDKLYDNWTTLACLSFIIEEETMNYFAIVIREKHGGQCPGDPNTAPKVDRFRVMRATKEILWYDFYEDEYVPYDRSKVIR